MTTISNVAQMSEKHGRGQGDAYGMLALFESAGVRFFDLTHNNIDGEKRGFRPKQSLAQLRTSLPYLLQTAPRPDRQNNIIIRPHHPPAVLLIQLDDLDAEKLTCVKDLAFMTLCTSPGNYQTWLAVTRADLLDTKDFSRRVRKAAGADISASGATRLAGTFNFKRKYAPAFPIVQITNAQAGRIVTPDALEALDLVAPPDPKPAYKSVPPTRRARGKWPSYQHCLARAPLAHGSDQADISRADFAWCMTAIDWGWNVDETAAQLMEESPKAQQNGRQYAITTATNAAAAVMRRRGLEYAP